MTKKVEVGGYVRCKGKCRTVKHYTSLNFYIGKHGHTCKDCLRDKFAMHQRRRRARLELGIKSYKEQLKE